MSILSNKDKEIYNSFPESIEEKMMAKYYHLTDFDIVFVRKFHGNINKIAISIQIGLIRHLGYLPSLWQKTVSVKLLNFVHMELKIHQDTIDLNHYGTREKTRTLHFQEILNHLKFRKWQPLLDTPIMEDWLVGRGMEHDQPQYLLQLLFERLYQEKILRPALSTLETLVSGIQDLLIKETYRRLSSLWKDDLFENLDNILEIYTGSKITIHRWLCTISDGNTSKNILEMLEKYEFLVQLGVQNWDLSCLTENRKKKLANFVRNTPNTELKRISPLRRYPMLICFLRESLLDITDVSLVMYRDYWQRLMSKSKKSLELLLLQNIKSQRQAIKTLTQISSMVVDERIESEKLRDSIFQFGYANKISSCQENNYIIVFDFGEVQAGRNILYLSGIWEIE